MTPNELKPGDREPCPGCGDGDNVPATGYWHCPVCDAEWHDESDEAPISTGEE